MREQDVDGALVGGASLAIDEFASIAQFPKHVGT
jgi:triosephosphate isomerase